MIDERTVMEQVAGHAGALAWRSAVALGGLAGLALAGKEWQLLVAIVVTVYGLVQSAVYFAGMFRPFGFVDPAGMYPTAEEIGREVAAILRESRSIPAIPAAPVRSSAPVVEPPPQFERAGDGGNTFVRRRPIQAVVDGLTEPAG